MVRDNLLLMCHSLLLVVMDLMMGHVVDVMICVELCAGSRADGMGLPQVRSEGKGAGNGQRCMGVGCVTTATV